MRIFSAEQIRAWDAYTISNEPVASVDLMERAALKVFGWIKGQGLLNKNFLVCCGKGNNGGDGLAIARMLAENHCTVQVIIAGDPEKGSADFRENLSRLPSTITCFNLQNTSDLAALDTVFNITKTPADSEPAKTNLQPPGTLSGNTIIIDAIFGSGLHKVPEGIYASLIALINQSNMPVISVDLPSGMFTDDPTNSESVVKATSTLGFQCYKMAYLFPSNAAQLGKLQILDIGLHEQYAKDTAGVYQLTDEQLARTIYRPRSDHSHKGTHGHALLVAGSYGKMGAAVLAASACLRAGAGLLTCHIPSSGYNIMQTALPEAMVVTDYNSSYNTQFDGDLSVYKTIGIGPGIGTGSETATLLSRLMTVFRRPMVIDADALNLLSRNADLLSQLPPGSILTPHPKEFERLFGKAVDDGHRFRLAIDKSVELKCVIVLKGQHTLVATPSGKGYFNNTGNAGLAKGGTGDTLTGIITAMLAQGYEPADAAILGVYLHGLTADLLIKENQSRESLMASDLIAGLGKAFTALHNVSDPGLH
ncbi:MAG: NAD(P)H-hydrate dehydratase [Chitinophagaceae bacterium]|nr:MAG: NAD(P)H-hydrate dehydratase [Chitinophagaceae bacterium]